MKRIRSMLAMLLIAALALIYPSTALAAEPYTYTVRFFAGQQGTIDGQEVIVYENLKYGDRVDFDLGRVTLNDGSKYYVKGVRESGKDNSTIGATSFVVTRDQDYVVAYGLLGNSVAYTVNYLDADGNALGESRTYYGNVGDKPVVAYLYIDGYLPEYYNLTQTLSANGENVFNFVYTPFDGTVVVSGEISPEAIQAGYRMPGEILDLDTGMSLNVLEAPAASQPEPAKRHSALAVAGGIAAVAVLCAAGFLVFRKKRNAMGKQQ